MFAYHLPLDPNCPSNPVDEDFWNDPMTLYSGCGDEIAEMLEDKHRKSCERCQLHGAAEIEVVGP